MAAAPEVSRALRAVVGLESAVDRLATCVLSRAGWRPQVIAYPGYGAAPTAQARGWVRVLARVLLLPRRPRPGDESGGRGWRRFLTISVPDHGAQGYQLQARVPWDPSLKPSQTCACSQPS